MTSLTRPTGTMAGPSPPAPLPQGEGGKRPSPPAPLPQGEGEKRPVAAGSGSAPPREIPAGYLEDAQGRLVAEERVRPMDLARDRLVRALIAQVEATAASLAATKGALLAKVARHVALVAEGYGVALSGEGGNVVLASYDGRMKVERVTGERLVVGAEMHAAEALVKEILSEIREPNARAIIDRAFRRDRKTGELSAARLIDLAAVEIDDERWRRAVEAIHAAVRAAGTVTYFRAYRRAKPTDPWEQIALDFSAIAPTSQSAAQPPAAPPSGNSRKIGARPLGYKQHKRGRRP